MPSLAATGYRPNGETALLDAIAHTVISTDERLTGAGRADEKVLVVVLTDGLENASREYTVSSLAALTSRYQARPNWTFVFLSAARTRSRTSATSRDSLVRAGKRDALQSRRGLGAKEPAGGR